MYRHPKHALRKISCVQMHSCVCSYFTADVAFTSTTYQPLSKKVQKFQEVFLFFFVFSKISRSCYFLSLLLLLILNLKNYRVARKTATKIFSNTRETNFLWQQDDPFTIVKGYICNYRYGFQKPVMHRKNNILLTRSCKNTVQLQIGTK